MVMNDKIDEIGKTDSYRLARLLDVDSWESDGLREVLRHQLSAPLETDLADAASAAGLDLADLCRLPAGSLRTFADLLHHPAPPLGLLQVCKEFAKKCRKLRNGPLPREVAVVLYYASIAAALTRCDKRITGLSNSDLMQGFGWTLAREWVDEPTKELVREGLTCVVGGG